MADEPVVDIASMTQAEVYAITPAQADAWLTAKTAEMHPPPPIAPTTAPDAQRRLDVLLNDPGWGKLYLEGNLAARQQYSELRATIEGGDRIKDSIEGTAPPVGMVDTSSEDQLSQHVLTQVVDQLRDIGINDATIAETLSGRPATPAEIAAVKALKAQRFGDPEWVKRLLSGSYLERREHTLMGVVLSSAVEGF